MLFVSFVVPRLFCSTFFVWRVQRVGQTRSADMITLVPGVFSNVILSALHVLRPNYWCGGRHSTSSRPLTELTTEIPASPRTINKLLAISQDAMFSARLVFISYCDRPSISEPPSWSPCMWTMRSWTARSIYLNLKNSSSLAPGVLRDRGRKLASLTPILLTYEYFDAVSYFIHI